MLEPRADVSTAILTDYVGTIQIISDPIVTGDATKRITIKRVIDVHNLDGNRIGCTIWNEMATEFDMEAYEAMEKPVTIVVLAVFRGIINLAPILVIQRHSRKVTEESSVPQCRDHGPKPIPNYR
ncbi:hypothetical protein Tco_0576212 [Tanacetum coccineum]